MGVRHSMKAKVSAIVSSLFWRIASRTSWWPWSVQAHSAFFFGRGRVVAAGGGHQDLLDQAGARAAGRAGLGVLAHLVDGEEALVLDRLADRALVDAVAAADLGVVGHGGGLGVALVAGVAEVGLAEHQLVADVAHAAAVAQQLEVPAAVHGVAVQAGADQLVVLDHQLLVDAAERVAHDDLFGSRVVRVPAGAPMKSPQENRSMPVTLSLVEVSEPV